MNFTQLMMRPRNLLSPAVVANAEHGRDDFLHCFIWYRFHTDVVGAVFMKDGYHTETVQFPTDKILLDFKLS